MTAMRRPRSESGLTMLELVVAFAIAAAVLASAWPWCWRATALATAGQREVEASSAVAYGQRTFCADVRRAVALAGPPASPCTSTGVTLALCDPATGRSFAVTYAYDPGRRVLWRKAAGTYLIENVIACRFSYYDGAGAEVAVPTGGSLAADALDVVRRVELTVTVGRPGAAAAEWTCEAGMRAEGR